MDYIARQKTKTGRSYNLEVRTSLPLNLFVCSAKPFRNLNRCKDTIFFKLQNTLQP